MTCTIIIKVETKMSNMYLQQPWSEELAELLNDAENCADAFMRWLANRVKQPYIVQRIYDTKFEQVYELPEGDPDITGVGSNYTVHLYWKEKRK